MIENRTSMSNTHIIAGLERILYNSENRRLKRFTYLFWYAGLRCGIATMVCLLRLYVLEKMNSSYESSS